jgi:hypothetical protein
MDGDLYAYSLPDFYTILYTVLDIYTNRNLYTDPELYPDYTVEYTHAFHYFVPQPII